jgi:hypothetical protein
VFGSERRRQSDPGHATALRQGLTAPQQTTLGTLEGFGWRLAFVRRPLFRDPVPVAVDRSGGRFVVIEADGGIDETPALRVRG